MTRSDRTSRETEYLIAVVSPMTEEQWRMMHRLAGEENPGRFKAWSEDFHFNLNPGSSRHYRAAVLFAERTGLTFRTEVTTIETYRAPEGAI